MEKLNSKKKPCKACPFRRDNTLEGEHPGGAHPFVYVGQSIGPFWLPCHKDKNYDDKNSDPKVVGQCAGAAIYRANTGSSSYMPEQILSLPEDKELVFATHEEFLSHYLKLPLEQVHMSKDDLMILLMHEMKKAEVKKVDL